MFAEPICTGGGPGLGHPELWLLHQNGANTQATGRICLQAQAWLLPVVQCQP